MVDAPGVVDVRDRTYERREDDNHCDGREQARRGPGQPAFGDEHGVDPERGRARHGRRRQIAGRRLAFDSGSAADERVTNHSVPNRFES